MRRTLLWAAAALLVLRAARRVAGGRLALPVSRYVVDGPSMLPEFRPGERLLVNRLAYARGRPRPGDVVVLRDPERPEKYLLKRVAAVPAGGASGSVFVLGDNVEQSRDSRHFGSVSEKQIVGKAWRRY